MINGTKHLFLTEKIELKGLKKMSVQFRNGIFDEKLEGNKNQD